MVGPNKYTAFEDVLRRKHAERELVRRDAMNPAVSGVTRGILQRALLELDGACGALETALAESRRAEREAVSDGESDTSPSGG